MPYFTQLLTYAPQVAAVLLAASRMIPKLGALWGRVLPAKWQWLPPVLVVALPQLADVLGVAKSPLDLVEAFSLAIALIVPGARSSAHVQLARGAHLPDVSLILPDDAPPPTPKSGSLPPVPALFLGLALLSPNLTACGKAALPPGCTEADFATLAATCPDEATCNEAIDAKHAKCNAAVEAE